MYLRRVLNFKEDSQIQGDFVMWRCLPFLMGTPPPLFNTHEDLFR